MTHITFNSLLNDLQKTQDARVPWSNNELTTSHPDDLIHSNKVTDKIDHQVHNTGSGTTHSLVYVDPTGKRHVLAVMDVYQHANESHPYVAYSQVSPKFKGKGFGKALYLQALKHHGSLRSDTHTSPNANKAWEWLGKQPNVLVKMGTPGTEESHIASYNQLAKSEDKSEVATVAVKNGDKLLMGKRSDNGKWTNPGGHLNENEGPKEGALRELFEEAGIKPDDIKYLGSSPVITPKGDKKIIHCYLAEGNYKHTAKNDPDKEVAQWFWIDISKGLSEEIANNLHSPKNILLQKLGLQEKLNKSEDLQKGVARKIAPHNPPRGQTAESKFLNYWTTHEDSSVKNNLPRHEGAIRFRALNKLSARTKTRVNPETNEKEFLLHRGMGAEEFDNGNSNKSSWTPKFNTAMTFGETYADDDRVNGRSHVVSAWIPESHMHNFPFMLGHDPKIKAYAGEYEVVVNPHKLQIHASGTPVEMRNYLKNKGKLTTIAQSLPIEEKRQIVRKKVDGNLGKSLEKGLKGDWQKEGYTLHVIPSMPLGTPKAKFDPKQHGFVVQVKDKDGKYAGSASIEHNGSNIIPYGITISPEHRRKGLASGIYKHSQELSGKKIVPEYVAEGTEPSGQSGDAQALWNQPNRPFGKSEVNPNHFKHILHKIKEIVANENDKLEKWIPKGKMWVPEHSDPEGDPNPGDPARVKGTSKVLGNIPVNTYNPQIQQQHENELSGYVNSVANSDKSDNYKQSVKKLYTKLMDHPDKHITPTLNEKNGSHEMRLRHLMWGLKGNEGYNITEHPSGGLIISADRHAKNAEATVNHKWHYDPYFNSLKFLK